MEWIETTAASVEEARSSLVQRLGVSADEVEFETLEEPRTGLFGRVKGVARVRARVEPKQHAPNERRQRSSKGNRDRKGGRGGQTNKSGKNGEQRRGGQQSGARPDAATAGGQKSSTPSSKESRPKSGRSETSNQATEPSDKGGRPARDNRNRARSADRKRVDEMNDNHDDETGEAMSLAEVAALVDRFLNGLVAAAELDATTDVLETEEGGLEAVIDGNNLGVLIGPGGRTLYALQDLCRTIIQRHATGAGQTRLSLDIAGFRAFRESELTTFVAGVVEQVRETGQDHVFEQMNGGDRKLVHEAVADLDDIQSSSIGEEPRRQVVLSLVVTDDTNDD